MWWRTLSFNIKPKHGKFSSSHNSLAEIPSASLQGWHKRFTFVWLWTNSPEPSSNPRLWTNIRMQSMKSAAASLCNHLNISPNESHWLMSAFSAVTHHMDPPCLHDEAEEGRGAAGTVSPAEELKAGPQEATAPWDRVQENSQWTWEESSSAGNPICSRWRKKTQNSDSVLLMCCRCFCWISTKVILLLKYFISP